MLFLTGSTVVRVGGIGVDRRARKARHRDVASLAPRGGNHRGAQLGVGCEHDMEAVGCNRGWETSTASRCMNSSGDITTAGRLNIAHQSGRARNTHAASQPDRRGTTHTQFQAANGFCQRNPGNLPKAPSVEHSINPCSIASAARCASRTRFPCTPGPLSNRPKVSVCWFPGAGIHAAWQPNHARTWRRESSMDSGCSNTRGLVTILKKASRLCQGGLTGAVPLTCVSSHSRAFSCWEKVLTWA